MGGPSGAVTALQEGCRILLRHRNKVAFCFVLLMVAPVLTILYAGRSYKSEAKLLVRVGHESVGLDPTATMGETIAVNTSREFEINSRPAIRQATAPGSPVAHGPTGRARGPAGLFLRGGQTKINYLTYHPGRRVLTQTA